MIDVIILPCKMKWKAQKINDRVLTSATATVDLVGNPNFKAQAPQHIGPVFS